MKCLKCGKEIPRGTTHRCGIVPRVVRKDDRSLSRWADIIEGKHRNTVKPKCPDHPDGTVTRASLSGTMRSVWVCLVCGKRLGDAGPRREPVRESFTVKKTKRDGS